MTPDQLKELKDISKTIDSIRGNEEEVKTLKSKVGNLIKQGVQDAKDKIDVLAEDMWEDDPDLPF